MPGIRAVWLCCYLPVRVFHQGFHDSSRAADPHLRAQVRLRLDSPVLHRALSYRLCKWVLGQGPSLYLLPTTLQAPLLLCWGNWDWEKGRGWREGESSWLHTCTAAPSPLRVFAGDYRNEYCPLCCPLDLVSRDTSSSFLPFRHSLIFAKVCPKPTWPPWSMP